MRRIRKARAERRSGIGSDVSCVPGAVGRIGEALEGEGVLPGDVQVAIYRICQEALNNVAKHARASKVEIHEVYLTQEDAAIELRISDDGRGFDPEQTTSGHYGLSMMRERAEGVDAQLSITSQPGRGTELIIRWAQTHP